MSPTVLREGPYRFFFYSNEPSRPNIHCRRGDIECKFWLEKNSCPDVSLKEPAGFSEKELNDIKKIVRDHLSMLLQNWYAFQGVPFPSYINCK